MVVYRVVVSSKLLVDFNGYIMTTHSKSLHPSEFLPREWVVSEQSIKSGAIAVEHQIQPASELLVPALTHHCLVVSLSSSSTRQVTRLGKEEYDGGPQTPGSFFLAAADDEPSFWSWNGTDETIIFTLDPIYFQTFAAESGCTSSESIAIQNIILAKDPQLEMLAQQYYAEMQQGGIGGQLFSESLSVLLMMHLLRNYTYQKPKLSLAAVGLGNNRLERVLKYVGEHLDESIGLDELAAIAGLSKCHFATMFKQSLGMPPYRYVLIQRIELAKRLLKQDDLAINEIALHCGFSDQSHFTKHFKKVSGTTPRAFREG